MAALIPIVLANLPAILGLGQAGLNFITSLRASAKQTGEWTADHDEQFIAGLMTWKADPAWLPDPKP